MAILLFPFALLYGFIIRIRNFLYDKGIIKSYSFDMPVIVIGNLVTGGTGKTPCVEYVVKLLKKDRKVAVLSRGYKRKTKGFIVGDPSMTWRDIGDEPLQMSFKFPDITVAVDRKRKRGIKKLLKMEPKPDCIIMDDGFQHRKVKPFCSILLIDYSKPYFNNYLLPVGSLREHGYNIKRADIIVVTKSPSVSSPICEKLMIDRIKPKPHQNLYFSYMKFGELKHLPNVNKNIKVCKKPNTIILFTGIANPSSIEQYLQNKCMHLISLEFPDHHKFTSKDINKIIESYDNLLTKNKIIVTTEKDMMRLKDEQFFQLLKDLPVFYLPVYFAFHPAQDSTTFDEVLIKKLDSFQHK